MPLVKIISAQPTTSAAAAAAMDAAVYNREKIDDIPNKGLKKIKLPEVKIEEEKEITHFGKVPLWKDDTPEGVLAMRKIHTDFIVEVHLHALGYLVVGITQWIFIYKMYVFVVLLKCSEPLLLLRFDIISSFVIDAAKQLPIM